MSSRQSLCVFAAVGLALLTAGCGSKKVVGSLKPQRPGQVTYTSSNSEPVIMAAGSASTTGHGPVKHSFERKPHFTYIVFRDEKGGRDHVVTMEAAGELTVSQEEVDVQPEESLFRVINVKPNQSPVSVSLKVKPIEVCDLASNKEEPRIIITSDGKVRLKMPSMWHLDDVFGLDEVKSITHTKGTVGSETITFALAEKEYPLDFASRETAAQLHADLERVVKPMAPHVQFSSGRSYLGVVILVGIVLVGILAAAGKASKG
ncbi:hypothetical protein [Zavarzinella formosa]|uniref:hypothetical protein n=1 Tax=Zavarzinella formosa TaxID=360055 RepID=UPI0002E8C916|nr:hypothetical protein [Zavarzinella formosa]